jgi:hypothetical protein
MLKLIYIFIGKIENKEVGTDITGIWKCRIVKLNKITLTIAWKYKLRLFNIILL